jgi:hypothetical protein
MASGSPRSFPALFALWFVFNWAACTTPAPRSPSSVTPPSAASSVAVTTASADTALAPLPAVVQRLRWSASRNEVRAALPELFAVPALRDEGLRARVEPYFSEEGLLVSLALTFDAAGPQEQFLAAWGSFVEVDRSGARARVYFNPKAHLRAVAFAQPPACGDVPCRAADARAGQVHLEEYWRPEEHVQLLGLVDGVSLLHASESELRQRFGHRYRARRTETGIRLPALGTDAGGRLLELSLREGVVQRISLRWASWTPPLAPQELLALASARFGAAQGSADLLRMGTGPVLTFSTSGDWIELSAPNPLGSACPDTPEQAMFHLRDALLRRDLLAVQACLPETRGVQVSHSYIGDEPGQLWTLKRGELPAAALKALTAMFDASVPECPPAYELYEDEPIPSVVPHEKRCFVGESASCGTLFRWLPTRAGLELDEVRFHCC